LIRVSFIFIYTFNFDGLLNTGLNDNDVVVRFVQYGGEDCGFNVDIHNNLNEDFLKNWLNDVVKNSRKVSPL
jgi:hypothetical protein